MDQEQLAAIARLHAGFEHDGIDYWLFGGWAVDFHAGRVTRSHSDIDVAVWQRDAARIDSVLAADGWHETPEPGADGYTVYEHGAVRLEMAFLARDADGVVYTPLVDGRGDWPADSFGADTRTVEGVRARIVTLEALIADKSAEHGDEAASAKDRLDVAVLRERREP